MLGQLLTYKCSNAPNKKYFAGTLSVVYTISMAGIFALSLGKTKATSILYKLSDIDHFHLLFKNNLASYKKKILAENPKHIIMLGIYSGRDRTHIRIETVCRKNNTVLFIPYAFEQDTIFITAKSIGNGLCNFYTAELVDFVADNIPETSVTFLHIPKKIAVLTSTTDINKQLSILASLQ